MLIFDSFPSFEHAQRFAQHVCSPVTQARVYKDVENARKAEPFPFELTAPVVLVERSDEIAEARRIEAVKNFGGQFVGT